MNKKLLLIICFFFLALASFVSAETIDGDSVYINDTQGIIKVNTTPGDCFPPAAIVILSALLILSL